VCGVTNEDSTTIDPVGQGSHVANLPHSDVLTAPADTFTRVQHEWVWMTAHLIRFCHVGANVSMDLTRDSMSPLVFQLSEFTGSFNSESTLR
jgi:hypothetical protein